MRLFHRFLKNNGGAAFAETVIIVPLFLLILSGIFELSMYALLNNKLVRAAGVLGDLITRKNISSTTLTAYMNTVPTVLSPFPFTSNLGKIVVSQIQNAKLSNLSSDMTISWQQNLNGGVSKIGSSGGLPTNLPGNVTVVSTQTMVVVEIFYQYSPLIFTGFIPTKQLYVTSVYVPRSGDMNTLLTQ